MVLSCKNKLKIILPQALHATLNGKAVQNATDNAGLTPNGLSMNLCWSLWVSHVCARTSLWLVLHSKMETLIGKTHLLLLPLLQFDKPWKAQPAFVATQSFHSTRRHSQDFGCQLDHVPLGPGADCWRRVWSIVA